MAARKAKAKTRKKTEGQAARAVTPPAFRRRRAAWASVAALGLASLGAFLLFFRSGPAPRPNLLLVSVDTLRPDHLSSYGATSLRTPHMDRLASEGVLFEDAVTVAPTTLPAHASLFTGWYPPRHGVRDNVGFHLGEGPPTLAAVLEAEGYETAAFVGAFVLDARFGLDRGFDLYDDDMGVSGDETAAGSVAQRRGDRVLENALAWLDARRQGPEAEPFFAFLHFYDPHTPYDPPSPSLRRGEALASGDDAARYRGEVAFVDGLVGRLLDWLDEKGLAGDTVVALVSDHGESLGEHGELTHGLFVYQSTLAIPLLLRFPGGPSGARVSGAARIVDVAPTLLELLGAPVPEGLDGQSLVSLVEGGAGETDFEPAIYAETFLPRLHYGWSQLRSLQQGRHKLILAPQPELYDLVADPGETSNLIQERAGLAGDLRRALEAIDTVADVTASSMDAESLARLRSLGYTASKGGAVSSNDFETLPDPKDRLDVYLVVNDPVYQRIAPEDPGFEEALERLENVLEEHPGVARAHTLYGDLLLKAGRLSEAERAFERHVELREDSFDGHYGLGVARQRLGRREEALQALERARALQPRDTRGLLRLAEVEAARGTVEAAERWLRQAIAIAPDPYLKDRLAQLLIDEGKSREARELLAKMAGGGEDALAAYNLGRLLLSEGDTEGAIRELRRAVELEPEDADAQHALGNALALSGRPEEALGPFQSAIRLSPCFAVAHANLGSALGQLGRLEEARASLEKAISCDPDYASAYRNLAAVHLELGNLPEAVEAMRIGVAADPDDPELRRTLSELEAYLRQR